MAAGYEKTLAADEVAALQLTDAIIGVPVVPDGVVREALGEHFSAAEIVEISLGVGLFLGMSKVLITLGLEPTDMPITVVPTPNSKQ